MNCLIPESVLRFASVMASITLAVPATLICHIRSVSSTPVRTGSMTNARCTTETGRLSRSSSYSTRVQDSSPKSRRSNWSGKSVWGELTSTPITEKSPSSGSNLDPRFPAMPVNTTTGFALAISSGWKEEPVAAAVAKVDSQPGVRCGAEPEELEAEASADAYAATLPDPGQDALPDLSVPAVQNMPRWFPHGTSGCTCPSCLSCAGFLECYEFLP